MNVSSLAALPPSLFIKSVSPSQNSPPHPEKRLGHKTRHPIPKKGPVTKLETPSREKARSQNSRHCPPDVTDVNSSAAALVNVQACGRRCCHHRCRPLSTDHPTSNSAETVRMRTDTLDICGAPICCIAPAACYVISRVLQTSFELTSR